MIPPITQPIDAIPVTDKMLRRHEQLRQTAQKWEAQTFYGTMLKQMRESPFKSSLFEGGRGGQAYGAMFDQELANRMASGAGSKLANNIVRSIEGSRVYKAVEKAAKAKHAQSNPASNHARNYVPSTCRA